MNKATTTLVDYSTLTKNSYAAFDAISLRNLIIERLNDKKVFTDQNYIGSNLAAVMDIVSYTFNTLMFYLNRTSTESMFTEAQIYENINRIVKLIDYKPIGYQTSTLSFQMSANSTFQTYGNFFTIPRYSYIVAGGIPFSFNEDVSFSIPSNATGQIELTNVSNQKLLYQGVFREAPLFISTGSPNETFIINSPNASIDHFNIHVYVYEKQKERWVEYKEVSNLYAEEPYSAVFEKRLNQDALYEITFGDGITGKKLNSGDEIAIYYLQSSGIQGIIGPNTLRITKNASTFNTINFSKIFEDVKQEKSSVFVTNDLFKLFTFDNIAGSTVPKEIEDAESIRKNAPANFKSQYRLVTQKDYETFLRVNHDAFLSDVRVFNNWEYLSLYLKYFNDIGITPTSFQQIPFNQIQYADACNFNNVYICAVPKTSLYSSLKYLLPAQKEKILNSLSPVKMLTTEVSFMDPVFKVIAIGTTSASLGMTVEDREVCRLEIIKTPGNTRTNQSIVADVIAVFQTAFDNNSQTLGSTIDISFLTSEILKIDGISQFNTVRTDTGERTSGLSLFVWNPVYPALDKKVVRINTSLLPFEIPYFENLATLNDKIFVTESLTGNIR